MSLFEGFRKAQRASYYCKIWRRFSRGFAISAFPHWGSNSLRLIAEKIYICFIGLRIMKPVPNDYEAASMKFGRDNRPALSLRTLAFLDAKPRDPASAFLFLAGSQTASGGFGRNPRSAPFLDTTWHPGRLGAFWEQLFETLEVEARKQTASINGAGRLMSCKTRRNFPCPTLSSTNYSKQP